MFLLPIYNCIKNDTFNTFNYLDKIPTLMCIMLDTILYHKATLWSQRNKKVTLPHGDRRRRMKLMWRSSKLAERTRLDTWVFMVKWQSSVTPRFLTESDKGTDELPTVIESGKEKERDLDFRPDDTITPSVFSSFSLSFFSVIQDLMSSIHFCIERKRSGIWWGGADFLESHRHMRDEGRSAFQLQ